MTDTATTSSSSGPISRTATFGIDLEREEQAELCLRELVDRVRDQRDGVEICLCHRSQRWPDQVVLFEVYRDQRSLTEQATTPEAPRCRSAFRQGLFLGPFEVVRINRVVG